MAYNFTRQKKSFFYFSLLLIISALVINSCKKDNKLQADAITDPDVISAKAWYDNTYPISKTSVGSSVSTLGIAQADKDYSQFIKPDWAHSANYRRFNKKVIEMPVDPSSKTASALRNLSTGKPVYKKEYSKTSFLILNDGSNYHAYIMMILADSAYIKNDLSKLSRTTYSKRDSNFTGMVLYFTPKGSFVSGWAYKNGKYVSPAHNASSSKSVQSVSNGIKTLTQTVCEDWYLDTFIDDELVSSEYLYTTCSDADDGGGGGGTTPPPCPPVTAPPDDASIKTGKTISQAAPIDNPIDPTDPGGGGLPPPDQSPCTVVAPPPPVDTLATVSPCQVALAISKNSTYSGMLGSLKSHLSDDHETYFDFVDPSNTNTYVAQAGTKNDPFVDLTVTGQINGVVHDHPSGIVDANGNSTPTSVGPTPGDFEAMYDLYKAGAMVNPSTFTNVVITSQQLVYMIVISDPKAFSTWGAANLPGSNNYNSTFYNNAAASGNAYLTQGVDKQQAFELALLDNMVGSGLTLLRGDYTSLNNWSALTSHNGTVSAATPCK